MCEIGLYNLHELQLCGYVRVRFGVFVGVRTVNGTIISPSIGPVVGYSVD